MLAYTPPARMHLYARVPILTTLAERGHRCAVYTLWALGACDPDVIVVDVNAWGAATVAEAVGRTWAMYSPYCSPCHRRHATVWPGCLRRAAPRGAVRDALIRRLFGAAGFDRAAAGGVNAARARHGLPLGSGTSAS